MTRWTMPGFSFPQRLYSIRWASGDRIVHLCTLTAAMSILSITAFLVYELYIHSSLSRKTFGWAFLASSSWDPVRAEFGALPFIYGTLVSSCLALLIAVPLGVGAAIFLSEMTRPRLARTLAFLVELLAAVPSVIYGLLGILLIVPLLRNWLQPFVQSTLGFLPLFEGPMFGVSMLAAVVVLTIMILPFIVAVSREALLAVPRDQREAALAVGATRWEATWNVVLPYAKLGLLSSVFLSFARAVGETMAVTMVIGNAPRISASLFAPSYTIAAVIANEFMEAGTEVHFSALIELGLVLLVITAAINGLARLVISGTAKNGRPQK